MFRCELKKMFSKKTNWIMLIAAFVLAVLCSLFAMGSIHYVDSDGVTHTGFTASRRLAANKSQWAGTLTADKFAKIVTTSKKLRQKYQNNIPDTEFGQTIQPYLDIMNFIISVELPDSEYDENIIYNLTEKQTKKLYRTYEKNIQHMINIYGKTPEQKKFLTKQYKKITTPFYYQSMDSWDTMAMYIETYGIALTVIIGFLASGIFAEEFRTGADAVFYATKYGRSKAAKNKIAAGLFMTTVVYWGGVGILSLLSFAIMGISGFQTPYQIYQPYSIYSITYGQYYLIMAVCGYIASLLAASLTILVTAKMHTRNIAVGIPFFLYCMMPFIGRALPSFTPFFDLMPQVLLNIMECIKEPSVYQIGNLVFRQVPAVMLIYGAISILLLPAVYRSFRRYGLQKLY